MSKGYLDLKQSIAQAITNGEYAPHDQLPSQRTLGQQFGLSHMSVRRAINELIQEGLIYAVAGKGLYAAAPKVDVERDGMVSFSEDMRSRGMAASSRILRAEVVSAPTLLAQVLGVEIGAALVYLRRLRLANDEPMAVQDTYLPRALCPDLLEQIGQSPSLFALLREVYHLRLARSSNAAEAVLATDEEARLLGMTLPAALLITEQITYLDNGQPVEFVRSAYRGDRYRLTVKR
ncbi:MAG: GntR family transcriptional regulator [Anaerolineae bacterium]|nr:GntR family transcriptional regulator [Anaerolineae bacterium]